MDTFPPEIVDTILSYISIPSLLMLGAVSHDHYIAVHNHIYQRSRNLVRPFVRIPNNLFLVLRGTKSIISGSSVLRMMVPSPKIPWEAKDLDIYTPRGRSGPVISFLEYEGYEVTERWSQSPDYHGGIFLVVQLTKGSRIVDVIESLESSAFTAVVRFHISAVMNFVSADGFFMSYPTLTEAQRALANPLAYSPATQPSPRVKQCYAKYRSRGFSILNRHLVVNSDDVEVDEGKPHCCQRSFVCPHTIRTTADPGCLFVPLVQDRSSVIQEDLPSHRVYDSHDGVIWHMGGKSCDGSYETMRPFGMIYGE